MTSDRVFHSSLAQEAFYYLEQLRPGVSAFNIATRFHLAGRLDAALLKSSFESIIERHEILRTRFEDESGELLQIVQPVVRLPFAVIDISHLSSDNRDVELLRLGQEEANKPFDLRKAPLIRVVLIRLADTAHVLHITVHHTVADDRSIEILCDELAAIYGALLEGRPSPLPPLGIQYAGFASWQRKFLAGPEITSQIEYWKGHLQDLPEPDISTDYPRPSVKLWNGNVVSELLPIGLTGRLECIAKESGASLQQVFLSAFKILLLRYTESSDIAVGFPLAGRTRPELDPLVGVFINPVVLRTDLSGDPDFHGILRRVGHSIAMAEANQDIPFEALVRETRAERDSSRNPLFQINFTHQRFFVRPVTFGGTRLSNMPALSSGSIFDLHFFTTESEDGWRLSCEFCTDLFRRDTALRMLGHFRMLLEGVATRPDTRISSLPLLTDEEFRQIMEWRGETTSYPAGSTIGILFAEIATRYPDKIALIHGGQRVTYRQLHAHASRLAVKLREAGVRCGTTVAVTAMHSLATISGLIAIAMAGGAYLPIDPRFPEERIRLLMDNSGASMILAEPGAFCTRPRFSQQIIPLEFTDESGDPMPVEAPELTASDPAYILFTSGSTGGPKGVVVPHQGVVRLVRNTNYMTFGPDEVFLQGVPLSFDLSTFEIWGPLLNGGTLVLLEGESTGLVHMAKALRDHHVTVLWLTTGIFQVMVDEHLDDMKGLRILIAGGDALPVAHVRRAFEGLPDTTLMNGYGPTENTTFTTCHTIIPADLKGSSIPIGIPIANTTVYIMDANGYPTPTGVPGEILTGGDGLALGYHDNPELTAAKFVHNPLPGSEGEILYHTGDWGRWRSDGTIEFLGRRDRQVKIRGVRVELAEVEEAISSYPAVGSCKVGTSGSSAWNKTLVAWIKPAAGVTIDRQELFDYLAEKLPAFLRPDAIVILDSFPLTTSGKIDVAALPAPNRNTRTHTAPPATETERQLAVIWCKLLDATAIGRDDNFFHLGGHSLMALELFSSIQNGFNVSLPLATLVQAPTLRSLALVLDARKQGFLEKDSPQPSAQISIIRRDGHLPPLFCIHAGGGGIICYRDFASYLPDDRPLLAIEAPALRGKGEIRVPSIEQTAVEYLDPIRKRQPHGPYFLCGHSYGGAVAYELARLLQSHGEQVALLALFDTQNLGQPVRKYTPLERALRYWKRQSDASLPERLKRVFLRLARLLPANKAKPQHKHRTSMRSKLLEEVHLQAMLNYHPAPFDGNAVLFRAVKGDVSFEVFADYGWKHLVNHLDIVPVPGTHNTIFDPENIGTLGAEFSRYLARIRP